jgi:hypothetical protein
VTGSHMEATLASGIASSFRLRTSPDAPSRKKTSKVGGPGLCDPRTGAVSFTRQETCRDNQALTL